ncbi:MAG: hypothetical protein KatS3mg104_1894 [Phycisphaerae bacterium]|nr:MAG: hypothetical protein KatS3mg104_1894 [Phycisphaerae bacterium]
MTIRTLVPNHGTPSSALWTGGYHAKHSTKPLLRDTPLPTADVAGDRTGSFFGTRSVTRAADFLFFKLDGFFQFPEPLRTMKARPVFPGQILASDDFPHHDLCPRNRQKPAPKMSSNIEKMSPTSIPEKSVRLPLHPLMTELIVSFAFGGIAENLVGFGTLFELDLGFLISRISVRVILHRQFAVGAFDLLFACRARNAEDFVIIEFD